MAWAYPGLFVVMAVEGALVGPAPGVATLVGAALLGASKALKFWAIATLGTAVDLPRPGPSGCAARDEAGRMRGCGIPNYVAVMGELASMALLVGARVSGPVAMLLFGVLMRQRIGVEESALRHPPCS